VTAAASLIARLVAAGTPAELVGEVALELGKAAAMIELLAAEREVAERAGREARERVREREREKKRKQRGGALSPIVPPCPQGQDGTSGDNPPPPPQDKRKVSPEPPLKKNPTLPLPTQTRAGRASVDEFEVWWADYPHKVGKADAQKAFATALKEGAALEELVEGVKRYEASKPPDRPWCNPATFIRQKRWLDEPAKILPFTGARNERRNPFAEAFDDLAAFAAGGGQFDQGAGGNGLDDRDRDAQEPRHQIAGPRLPLLELAADDREERRSGEG
jgi:hypothetical protein